ncbi:hypothetical protein BZA70DRAFT_282635 [Myxozyma melibiosi]|uniref:Uncharacterized protein n=1 Tax=Myxozyma melibiosi TaxID=54550 RepID=A0ABR1F0X6_9ASCO
MPPPSVTVIKPGKSSSLRVVTSHPMGQSASEGAAVASSPFESMFTRRSRTTTHDSMCSDTSTTIMQPFGEYEMVHDDRESIVSSGFGGAQEPSVATTVYRQVGESDASSFDDFGGHGLGATATIDEVENEDMTTPRVKQTEQYHPQQQQPRSSPPASPSLRKIASDLTDATTTTTTTQDDTYYSATNLLAGYEDSRSNSSVTVATADLASSGGLPRSSARSSVGMGGNARSSVASDFDEAHTGRGLLLLQTYAARQQNEQQQQESLQREPAALEKLRSLPEDQSASVIGLGFVPVDQPQSSSSSSSAAVSPSKPQVPASRPIPKSRSGSASSSSDRKRLSTLDNNPTTSAMPPPQYIPTRRFIHHSLLPSYQRSMQDLDLASGKLDDLLAQWWERNSSPVASPAMQMQPGTPTPNMV